jgi:hypothetical protein
MTMYNEILKHLGCKKVKNDDTVMCLYVYCLFNVFVLSYNTRITNECIMYHYTHLTHQYYSVVTDDYLCCLRIIIFQKTLPL